MVSIPKVLFEHFRFLVGTVGPELAFGMARRLYEFLCNDGFRSGGN